MSWRIVVIGGKLVKPAPVPVGGIQMGMDIVLSGILSKV